MPFPKRQWSQLPPTYVRSTCIATESPLVGFGPDQQPAERGVHPAPVTPSVSGSAEPCSFYAPPRPLINGPDRPP